MNEIGKMKDESKGKMKDESKGKIKDEFAGLKSKCVL